MMASIKHFTIFVAGLVSVLMPLRTYCAEEMKFRHVRSFYSDGQETALKYPEGIACGENSELIVADSGNYRLLRYAFSGGADTEPVISAIKLSQATYPLRTQINTKNEIFVLDGKLRRIIRFSAQGKFIGFSDPPGMPAAAIYSPKGFYIDQQDNIYIVDIFSRQLIVLNSRGKPVNKIPFPQSSGIISDLTVDNSGNILLLDSVNARVFFKAGHSAGFSALTESLTAYVRFPTNLTTDQSGRIYLVDRHGGKIIILARDGSYLGRLSAMGWKEGLLNHPSQICINQQGQIVIADTRNNRVQVFEEIK